MAQSPPAMNMAVTTGASCQASGRSRAKISTTLSRLPTVWADCPQTRAKALQKKTRVASGRTMSRPAALSSPKTPHITPPRMLKESRAAMRGRIGPPRSQKQVRLAASAI